MPDDPAHTAHPARRLPAREGDLRARLRDEQPARVGRHPAHRHRRGARRPARVTDPIQEPPRPSPDARPTRRPLRRATAGRPDRAARRRTAARGPAGATSMLGDVDLYLFNEGSHVRLAREARRAPAHRRRRRRARTSSVWAPERRAGLGHRRLQRLGQGHPPDGAARGVGHLGAVRARRRARRHLQVPHPLAPRGLPGRQGRPVRGALRDAAADRLEGVGPGLRVGRRRRGWPSASGARRSTSRCRSTSCTSGRGSASPRRATARSTTREMADPLIAHVAGARVHPRRVHAADRAPVRRLVGLPDHRLLRADVAVRDPAGPQVPDRPAAPGRHRRDPRLGAVALPLRRARAGLLRRHPPVRARRPAQGLPPRLEQLHLQLRPARGAQLPAVVGAVLARRVPRRRDPGRRGRVDALPRLLAQGRRVDPQRVGRQREPRGDRVPAPVQRGGLRRLPGRADHRRGVDRLADGVAPDLRRRARVRHEVGHGLDARHPGVLPAGPDPPQVPPRPAHVPGRLRVHRELLPAAVPRRGRARQGVDAHQDARRRVAEVRQPAGPVRLHVHARRARSCCSWATSSASGRSGATNAALDWHLLQPRRHAGLQRCLGDLARLYRDEPALHDGDVDPAGFAWLDAGDWEQSVVAYRRRTRDGTREVVVVLNLTPVPRDNYRDRGARARLLGRALQLRRGRATAVSGSATTAGCHTTPLPSTGSTTR